MGFHQPSAGIIDELKDIVVAGFRTTPGVWDISILSRVEDI